MTATTPAPTFTSYADQLTISVPAPTLVPIFDDAGRRIPRAHGVALRDPYTREISAPLAVVGDRYTPPDLRQLGQAIDDATALVGGYASLGPARVRVSGRTLQVLAGPTSGERALVVPRLSGDPSDRVLSFRVRSALDGTAKESADVVSVRIICTNGLVGWGSLGGFSRRHTSGLDGDRASWAVGMAAALPLELRRQATVLRRLREDVRFDRAHTAEVVSRLVTRTHTDMDAPLPTLSTQQSSIVSRIVDLVRTADGSYVPASIHGAGLVDGLQILEAATAYDRHLARGDQARRADRVASGDGIGTRALQWGIRAVSALDGAA